MFFFDVSTSGFLSLEKKIERGLRKKYDRHLGGKKFEIRGATNNNNNNNNNEKEEGAYSRQCIILIRDTKTNTFSDYKKSFLNCFIKKKTFGKASGRKRVNASSLHEPTVIRGFVHIYI